MNDIMSDLSLVKEWIERSIDWSPTDSYCMSAVRALERVRHEVEQMNKLRARILDALVDMIYQYLPDNAGDGRYSHMFMSAGENTLGLMEELGLMREVAPEVFAFDEAALNEVLKEAQP